MLEYQGYDTNEEPYQIQILSDLQIDNYIESYKEAQEDLARLEKLEIDKIEQVKFNSQIAKQKVENKLKFIEDTLKFNVMNSKDKKELKSMWKKSFVSGDVQVKKAHQKIVNPKLEGKVAVLTPEFKDYCDEFTDYKFRWVDLKKDLDIKEGNIIINKITGEALTGVVSIEEVPEVVVIK